MLIPVRARRILAQGKCKKIAAEVDANSSEFIKEAACGFAQNPKAFASGSSQHKFFRFRISVL
jgi:hypothetical protein